MSLYWAFDLDSVARACLYLDRLDDTERYEDVQRVIAAFRIERPARPWTPLPF